MASDHIPRIHGWTLEKGTKDTERADAPHSFLCATTQNQSNGYDLCPIR